MFRIYTVQSCVTRDLKVVFVPLQKVFEPPSAELPTLLEQGIGQIGFPSFRGDKVILRACKSGWDIEYTCLGGVIRLNEYW
jgi:hypothetical protein